MCTPIYKSELIFSCNRNQFYSHYFKVVGNLHLPLFFFSRMLCLQFMHKGMREAALNLTVHPHSPIVLRSTFLVLYLNTAEEPDFEKIYLPTVLSRWDNLTSTNAKKQSRHQGMSEECAGLRANIFEHSDPINLFITVVIKPRVQVIQAHKQKFNYHRCRQSVSRGTFFHSPTVYEQTGNF